MNSPGGTLGSAPPGHSIIPAPPHPRLEPARRAGGEGLDVQRWVSVFRRRAPLFLAVAVVIFTTSAVTTLMDQRKYTAQADIVVDARREQIVDAAPVVQELPRSTSEANIVDTQAQLLRSRQLAERVAIELKLAEDPEFNPDLRTLTGPAALLQAVVGGGASGGTAAKLTEAQVRQRVVDALLAKLSIRRHGLTYVIGIAFTSKDPAKAARIADAFAENFLVMQMESKADATRRVSEWLNGRINDLRQQVQRSEADIESYKIANNLLSASGATLTEQGISTYSQQVAAARASRAEDQARLDTARAQLAHGSSGEDVGEALDSDVVRELRSQRASVSLRVAGFQGRYGPQHPELLKAQQELADIDSQIQAEVQRIISNLEAKLQVSSQRVGSIEGALYNAQSTLALNNRASVRLRELERNAEAIKAVYESFLNRYKETRALEGMVQPDARLVSAAKVPTAPSFPDVKMNLTLGALVALMGGLAAVSVAELFSSGLSTAEDVEQRTGAAYLGSVPLLDIGSRRHGSPSAYVLSRPQSAFADALRGLRNSLLHARDGTPPQVVAVTSSLPGEGKTVTTVCLARSIALSGDRTIVVDCDLHRASLTKQMSNPVRGGLLEVLDGSCTLEEVLVWDEQTGAAFLPLVRGPGGPPDLTGSDAIKDLFERLRRDYDRVILDTAPVLGIADTRVLAALADAVLLLVHWRKTPTKAVETSLTMLENAGACVAGVALTQVDLKQQSRSGYGDAGYYYEKFKGYYVD